MSDEMARIKGDMKVLEHAGLMGHTFCVISDDGKGKRCVQLETSSQERATREAANLSALNPRIFRQISWRKWRSGVGRAYRL